MIEIKSSVETEKDIWIVWTNTDLTEGRGNQYPKHYCELEATAKRLAKGSYVMGSISPISNAKAYKIGNTWYYPNALIVSPTAEDKKAEEQLTKANILKEKQDQILKKAKDLGLTDEDIKLLKEGIK